MFKKLNISLPKLDFDKLKDKNTLEFGDPPRFKEYSVLNTEYLFEILSTEIQFDVKPSVNLTEILYPGVGPHVDVWQTAINFYFDSTDDETFFWKHNDPTINLRESSRSFRESDLVKVDSFKANTGDVYLLDVGNSIHSVRMSVPNTSRKILRLFWRGLSFDQVLNSLKFSDRN